MKSQILVRAAVAVFCLVLGFMLASAPSRADVPIVTDGINFTGTLNGVKPDIVSLKTPHGLVSIPPQAAMYTVGGTTVNSYGLQQLAVGTPVNVSVSDANATLQSVLNGIANIALGRGGTISLPVPVIPEATQKKTKVYVRLRNGNVVHVPLNAAYNMQRSQGATILTSVPAGTVITPQTGGQGSGHGQGHGQNQGQGQGQGQGHGQNQGQGQGQNQGPKHKN